MNCLHCQQTFTPKRKTKKYCSNTCKQYAYLSRNPVYGEIANENIENMGNTISINEPEQKISLIENKPFISHNYEKIRPRILDLMETSFTFITSGYFLDYIEENIFPENAKAFTNICKKTYCIIENLFFLSYKRKVYCNTIHCLYEALVETLNTEQLKKIPEDFPFLSDLFEIQQQLKELLKILRQNKEGIKFSMEINKKAKYTHTLKLLREELGDRPSFRKTFSHFFE